MKKKRTRRY